MNASRLAVSLGFLALLAMVAKPVWEARDQPNLGLFGDDGIYWVAAKSLADGNGYRVLSLPGQPWAAKYPPLYPLFLSAAWRLDPVFPRNLPVAAGLQAALLPVYLALVLLALRQFGFSWRRTFLLAAMTLVVPYVLLMAISLMAEVLLCCFLLASIVAMERAVAVNGGASRWWALGAGLLGGAAYLTRSAALPLFAAVPLFCLLRRRVKLSAFFLAAALPLAAAWHLWTMTHAAVSVDPANSSYLADYLRIVHANGFWPNLGKQVADLSSAVSDSFFPGIAGLLGGLPLHHLVLAAAIAGGIRLGRRQQWPLYLVFAGLYLGMLLFWAGGLARYLVPVWPALLAGIAEEASHFASLCEQAIARSRHGRDGHFFGATPRWALIAVAGLIAIRSDWLTSSLVSAELAELRAERSRDNGAFAWVARNAGTDSVALAWKDAPLYLYTRVPASRSLYRAVAPVKDGPWTEPGSFASLPAQYRRAFLVVLDSDFGPELGDRGIGTVRRAAESIAEARLEYRAPGAFIYSLPLRR
jgi:hypothetical protein